MTNLLLGIIAVLLWIIWGQLLAIKLLMVVQRGKVDAHELEKIQLRNGLKFRAFGFFAAFIVIGYALWASNPAFH